MPHSRKRKGLPDYARPPVNEVACGIVFEPLEWLKAPHTGALWQRLGEDRFPICEHAETIGGPPVVIGATQIPRIWYITEKGDELIQLQKDRLLFNWRRRSDDDVYPRYRTIISSFTRIVDVFLNFTQTYDPGNIRLKECELTYFNHIYESEGWHNVSDIRQVLPDISWRSQKRFLPNPTTLNWGASFDLPKGMGLLQVNVRHGKRRSDQKPVFSLELSAKGLGRRKDLEAAWEWFELAHEWIVCGFADLSSTEIQQSIWKRIDNGEAEHARD